MMRRILFLLIVKKSVMDNFNSYHKNYTHVKHKFSPESVVCGFRYVLLTNFCSDSDRRNIRK